MSGERPPDDAGWLASVDDLRVQVRTSGLVLVDSVTVHVEPGEAVGLVGESGCGKTLTVLAMAGLLPEGVRTAAGRVQYDGRAIEEGQRAPLGSGIGFVFQDPAASLTPVLTVGSQIAEVVREVGGASARTAVGRSIELLAEVGIESPAEKAGRYPNQLSGGEKQRVGIAIALAADPSLLIADEPTTGVDVIVQAQILALLGRLRKERGMSLVLVSHDLAVVAEVCDRVLVLYAGQVVEAGSVEDVLLRPVHPYTRGLIGCMPRFGAGQDEIQAIPGTVPLPGKWPTGCRFADRCSQAFDQCAEPPPNIPIGGVRSSRCWLPFDGSGA